MKVVVDTNIVFSGLLNAERRIARLLLQAPARVQFYTSHYLRAELHRHQAKLLRLTRLSEADLRELLALVTRRIVFINEGLLPATVLRAAEALVQAIDPDDTPFVALALHLDAYLWTGDRRLSQGLGSARPPALLLTTAELAQLLEQ